MTRRGRPWVTIGQIVMRVEDLLSPGGLSYADLARAYKEEVGCDIRTAKRHLAQLKNGIDSDQVKGVRRVVMPGGHVHFHRAGDSMAAEIEARRLARIEKVWIEAHTCPRCKGKRQLINPRTGKHIVLVETFYGPMEYADCSGCKFVWPLGPRRELRNKPATVQEAFEISLAGRAAKLLQKMHYQPSYLKSKRLKEFQKALVEAPQPRLVYTVRGWLWGGQERPGGPGFAIADLSEKGVAMMETPRGSPAIHLYEAEAEEE